LLYALYTVRARRFGDARDAIERALALDPLNPRTHRAAGTIAYASRRFADAIPEYRRALELNPKMSNAHAFMGDCLMELKQMQAARTAYAAEPAAMFRLRGQAALEHRAGDQPAAQKAFDQLVSDVGDAATYQQAEVMAQWGRTDDALRLLDRARAIGDSGLSYVATDPLLDPIARDPRFVRFVRDIGFA
jgi:tetratricopeptide (TPR) repeat protein